VGFKIDNSDFLKFGEDDAEFVPIIAESLEEDMDLSEVPEHLPILPLRNTVLFPGVVIPITVGREKSINLVREIYKGKRMVGVLAQKDTEVDEPSPKDLYGVGTMAQILKILQMPDDTTSVIIQGKRRFQLEETMNIQWNWEVISPVIKLGIFPSALSFLFYTRAIREIGITKANTFTNFIPVFTAILSFFILSEEMPPGKVIGIIVVVTGLLISQKKKHQTIPGVH